VVDSLAAAQVEACIEALLLAALLASVTYCPAHQTRLLWRGATIVFGTGRALLVQLQGKGSRALAQCWDPARHQLRAVCTLVELILEDAASSPAVCTAALPPPSIFLPWLSAVSHTLRQAAEHGDEPWSKGARGWLLCFSSHLQPPWSVMHHF
jgi:hypothetical protein